MARKLTGTVHLQQEVAFWMQLVTFWARPESTVLKWGSREGVMGGGVVWVFYSKGLTHSEPWKHSQQFSQEEEHLPAAFHKSHAFVHLNFQVQFQLENIFYSLKRSLLCTVSISIPITMARSRGGCICMVGVLAVIGQLSVLSHLKNRGALLDSTGKKMSKSQKTAAARQGGVENEGQSLQQKCKLKKNATSHLYEKSQYSRSQLNLN